MLFAYSALNQLLLCRRFLYPFAAQICGTQRLNCDSEILDMKTMVIPGLEILAKAGSTTRSDPVSLVRRLRGIAPNCAQMAPLTGCRYA
jgi:hypothetical protein